MDMSRYASSSSYSNPTPTKFCCLFVVDADELPSPTPSSPVHLAAQYPRPIEMDAPTAAVSSNFRPVVVELDELPSPTPSSPVHLAAQHPRPIEIYAPNAAVSSNFERVVVDLDELPSPTPSSPVHVAAHQPRRPIEMDAPTAAVSSNFKPVVFDLDDELPSPTPPPANGTSTRHMETSLAASSSKPKFTMPRTIGDIFQDFSSRRDALIRALTTDQEEFFRLCDPDEVPLFLHGHADGSWEVTRQDEMAPPDMPEPAAGLNFVRDQMTRFDWLSRVAVHADAWLAGVAHFFAATLNAKQKLYLFEMMNDLPTTYEAFEKFYIHDNVWLRTDMPLSSDLVQNVSNPNMDSGTPDEENPNSDSRTHDEHSDDQNFCAACGDRYHANGFWICCDICNQWFHGKCVNIRASEAKYMNQFKCPDCVQEEILYREKMQEDIEE